MTAESAGPKYCNRGPHSTTPSTRPDVRNGHIPRRRKFVSGSQLSRDLATSCNNPSTKADIHIMSAHASKSKYCGIHVRPVLQEGSTLQPSSGACHNLILLSRGFPSASQALSQAHVAEFGSMGSSAPPAAARTTPIHWSSVQSGPGTRHCARPGGRARSRPGLDCRTERAPPTDDPPRRPSALDQQSQR